MFRLRKLNVVKVVSSENEKNRLIEKGFVEIQVPFLNNKKDIKEDTNNDYENMNYTELKSIASEKGINTYKLKKEDIIAALQEMEG
ncbi:MAG: hypothetical protein PWQ70_2190 [Clostridiales bacterium]|nr:hypothetical protein [Clostridiales bacterium]